MNTSDQWLAPLPGPGSSVDQSVPGDRETERHQTLHSNLRAAQGLHLPQEHRQLVRPLWPRPYWNISLDKYKQIVSMVWVVSTLSRNISISGSMWSCQYIFRCWVQLVPVGPDIIGCIQTENRPTQLEMFPIDCKTRGLRIISLFFTSLPSRGSKCKM